jgi:2-polyprenyl-3-methyl-5-hydroxy-6-metoxy-1,4-benzoquinol methylase
VEKQHDLCFVGNILPGPRRELLQTLRQRYPRMHIGRAYFDEMAATYSASKIVFNRSVGNDINMRVFEALACGSLLLTNDLRDNGQSELFEADRHFVTYIDQRDLFDKIEFYLTNGDLRERIAAQGREEVVARHTYRHRMATLLATVEEAVALRDSQERMERSRPPAGEQPSCAWKTDPAYFEFERPELVALVPEAARRVLDVGCGSGRLGAAIKARQPAAVWGVEQNVQAAAGARTRLDRVLEGDVERLELPRGSEPFDCIVCGDILEHVVRPLALLRKLRSWLTVDGTLVTSIPNVRHHSVIAGLLAGNWTYESAGLLDRTHVRFFMRSSIARLFQEAGFRVTYWGHTSIGDYEAWEQQGRPPTVRIGGLEITGPAPDDTAEFFIYQHLVCATPCSMS